MDAEALEFIEETMRCGYSLEEATAMYKEMAGEDGVLDGDRLYTGQDPPNEPVLPKIPKAGPKPKAAPKKNGPSTAPAEHEGIVKSKDFNGPHGPYGFIESDVVREMYGKNLFFSPKTTGQEIYDSLAIGDPVQFHIDIDDGNGKPVARRVRIKGVTYAPARSYVPYSGKAAGPPKDKGPAETPSTNEGVSELEKKRLEKIEPVDRSFLGVVKSKSNAYGFIDSPDATALYGRDIFFGTVKANADKLEA